MKVGVMAQVTGICNIERKTKALNRNKENFYIQSNIYLSPIEIAL